MQDRRRFLTTCSTGIAAALVARSQLSADEAKPHSIAVFAKPLQTLSAEELGKRLQSIGVDGIEATLRAGGQVEPQDFESGLPRLCEALAKFEQRVVIAASDINEVTSETERQLRMLAANGIGYVRTSYYRYDFKQPILPQLDHFATQAAELAQLCKSLGIRAIYQNHAGTNYVGAALWDLQRVLSEVDPQHFGVALDIRHTAVELTNSWLSAYLAIRPQIAAIYVKDFDWVQGEIKNVPLGEGRSRPLFERIQADGLIGPLSLHVEYIDHRDDALLEQRWEGVRQDLRTLREWMDA